MQNAALKALGLDHEWSYGAIEVPPEGFEEQVRKLAASGEYRGLNITVPHKEAALRVATTPTREALAIGAANTLVFDGMAIEAHNTDVGGLIGALKGIAAPRGRRALVLGAGGASRAAIWALSQSGAVVDVELGVDVWNRSFERAERVAAELGGAPVPSPLVRSYGIVVNTTTVGLRGEDPFKYLPLGYGFDSEQVVVDMVYGKDRTPLLAAADEAGATTVDGLEILVQQGARSLEIWTGCEPDLDVMREAARRR
jgi:shikimate dehydrogenase